MKARLFCHHCDKHYEVDLENIRLFQKYKSELLTFERNTYYCSEECFFMTLKKLKTLDEAKAS